MLMCSKVGNLPTLLCLLSLQVHLSDPEECVRGKRGKLKFTIHMAKLNPA